MKCKNCLKEIKWYSDWGKVIYSHKVKGNCEKIEPIENTEFL